MPNGARTAIVAYKCGFIYVREFLSITRHSQRWNNRRLSLHRRSVKDTDCTLVPPTW